MSEIVEDTGFDAVIAGEVYTHPDPAELSEKAPEISDSTTAITVAVNPGPLQPHVCVNATGGARCDICFAPLPAGLTPEGVQAAKALVALPPLDWPTLAKLAREIAMDIKERSVILSEIKLNAAQYEFLEANNEFYRTALAAACKEWHAPLSTQERLKIEAAAILEDGLVGLGTRMSNRAEGLPGVIEAAKFFAKVAGVGEREAGSSHPGERFTINIDLGGDQKIVVQAAPPSGAAAPGDTTSEAGSKSYVSALARPADN